MNTLLYSAAVSLLIGLLLVAGVAADDMPLYDPMEEDFATEYLYATNAAETQGAGDAPSSQGSNLKEDRIWDQSIAKRAISSAITPDGSFIAVGIPKPGEALLLDRDGETIWSTRFSSSVYSIATSSDGSFTAVAADKLYVIYPHGGEAWSKDLEYYVYGTAISSDGSVIIGSLDDGSVRCFDRNGFMRWQFQAGEDVHALSTSSDGTTTAVGSDDGYIYLLNGYGSVAWNFDTHSPVRSISLSSDGSRIAAATIDRMAYIFDNKGFLLWEYAAQSRINSVSVSSDGLYIAIAEGCRVHVFDQDGTMVWEYDTTASSRFLASSSTGATYGPEVTTVALSSFGSNIVIGTGEGDPKISLYSLEPAQSAYISNRPFGSVYDFQPYGGQSPSYTGGLTDGNPYTYTITRKEEGARNIYTVRMSASSFWVDAKSGYENVSIARMTWAGEQELLPTTFSGHDLQGNYIFEAVTDKEITRYVLVFDAQNGTAGDAGQIPLLETFVFIALLALVSIGLFVFTAQQRDRKQHKQLERLILDSEHGQSAELEPSAWINTDATDTAQKTEPESDFGRLESLIRGRKR